LQQVICLQCTPGFNIMRVLFLLLAMLLPLMAAAQGNNPKALGRVTHESVKRAGVTFDPGQSHGVFVGINQYTAPRGVKPPNLKSCVNDAVDLAAAFMDLGLITGPAITLALSGEPSKPASADALARLLASGAVRLPDARRDTISDAVYAAAEAAGPDGILFLTWSAHGFEAGGIQYLTPANFSSASDRPSTAEIQANAIAENGLVAIAQSSKAQRRMLLFDACRETKAMAVGVPQLIGAAAGTVTLYAVTSGELALDGGRNGAFTEKVLGALTGPPPLALKSDRNGHITVGTLLDYLGTAGRIEDPRILSMPLREDPRAVGQVQERDAALAHFTAAKQIDLAAPPTERMLDDVSLGAVEKVLFSSHGPAIALEISQLLGSDELRRNFRNRRSFQAVLAALPPEVPTPTPAPPEPAQEQATPAAAPSVGTVTGMRKNYHTALEFNLGRPLDLGPANAKLKEIGIATVTGDGYVYFRLVGVGQLANDAAITADGKVYVFLFSKSPLSLTTIYGARESLGFIIYRVLGAIRADISETTIDEVWFEGIRVYTDSNYAYRRLYYKGPFREKMKASLSSPSIQVVQAGLATDMKFRGGWGGGNSSLSVGSLGFKIGSEGFQSFNIAQEVRFGQRPLIFDPGAYVPSYFSFEFITARGVGIFELLDERGRPIGTSLPANEPFATLSLPFL